MSSPVTKKCPNREIYNIAVKCKHINSELQTKDSASQFTIAGWQYFPQLMFPCRNPSFLLFLRSLILFIAFIFVIIIYVCVDMFVYMCFTTRIEISFLHVGPRDRTQILSFGSKCFPPLITLTSPFLPFDHTPFVMITFNAINSLWVLLLVHLSDYSYT